MLTDACVFCCAEGTPQSEAAEKKSALNPFAKSFSFNPMAKEFTPSGGAQCRRNFVRVPCASLIVPGLWGKG